MFLFAHEPIFEQRKKKFFFWHTSFPFVYLLAQIHLRTFRNLNQMENKTTSRIEKQSLLYEKVLRTFEKILTIPRGSKNHGPMHQFLTSFAEEINAKLEIDKAGNVGIFVNPPFDSKKSNLIFQSHFDMVTLKEERSTINFDIDAIAWEIIENGNILRSKDCSTTLGADNGMGLATSLVVAKECQKTTPFNLFLLCSSNEEIGCLGAKNLEFSSSFFPQNACVLNLDSEEGVHLICIGCPGSSLSTIQFELNYDWETNPRMYTLIIQGCRGGHSGVDISKKRANAIKLMIQLIYFLRRKLGLKIAVREIQGGEAENSIPKNCKIVLSISHLYATIEEEKEKEILLFENIEKKQLEWRLQYDEEELKISLKRMEIKTDEVIVAYSVPNSALDFLYVVHQGIIENFNEESVATSTNLSLIRTDVKSQKQNPTLELVILSRSLYEEALAENYYVLSTLLKTLGCRAFIDEFKLNGKPWRQMKPIKENVLFQMLEKAHSSIFGDEKDKKLCLFTPHGGLESQYLQEKFLDWIILSIGPKIVNAHTTKEYVDLTSVREFSSLLFEICQNMEKNLY